MSQRSISIDYLKCLLAIGVVVAHSLLIHMDLREWSYLLGMSVLRSLVPAFSVVSGFCFFFTRSRGKSRKWLAGLVLAYAFWTLFYVPIWLKPYSTLHEVLIAVVFGTMHLWYIAGLIVAAVLIMGFLRLGEITRSGLWPMLLAALVLYLLGQAMSFWAFFAQSDMPLEYQRNGLTVIFPFAAIGYALAVWVARNGRDRLPRLGLLWLAVAVLFGARLVEAMIVLRLHGLSLSVLPEMPLLAILAPVLLFLAFLRADLPEVNVNLSNWSSSIYFLHIFVILFLRHFFGIDDVVIYVAAGVSLPVIALMCWDRMKPVLFRLLGRHDRPAAGGGPARQTLRPDQI